jgi:hypothetical protein
MTGGKTRNQLVALLPVDEQTLGPEHPDTLTVGPDCAGPRRRTVAPDRALSSFPVPTVAIRSAELYRGDRVDG